MNRDDAFERLIVLLKKEMTDIEIENFLFRLSTFSSAELYFVMMSFLTEEDFRVIESKITQEQVEEEIEYRFKIRTGFTPDEFISGLGSWVGKTGFGRMH